MRETEDARISEVMLKLDKDVDLSKYRALFFSPSSRSTSFSRKRVAIVNGRPVEYTSSNTINNWAFMRCVKHLTGPSDAVFVGLAEKSSMRIVEFRNGRWLTKPDDSE